MIALMNIMGAPLIKCARGSRSFFTIPQFDPTDLPVVDWERSSPVWFSQHEVDKASRLHLVRPEIWMGKEHIFLEVETSIADECAEEWAPRFDEYFGSPYWRNGSPRWRKGTV
jgi:hypothetical protein